MEEEPDNKNKKIETEFNKTSFFKPTNLNIEFENT